MFIARFISMCQALKTVVDEDETWGAWTQYGKARSSQFFSGQMSQDEALPLEKEELLMPE